MTLKALMAKGEEAQIGGRPPQEPQPNDGEGAGEGDE
jgi:hypothetical protein